MKASLALSLLLAAVFATLLWRGQRRLDNLDAGRRAADRVGIDFPGRMHVRDDRAHRADAVLPDLLAFCRRDTRDFSEGQAIHFAILELPPGELKKLLARLLAAPGIPAEVRRGITEDVITQLAAEDPAGALEIFSRHRSELKERNLGIPGLATAIGQRAKEDPQAALAWFLENQKAQPEFFTPKEASALFRGTAAYDPRLAFALFDTFGAADLKKLMPDPADPFAERNFVTEIAATARTDSQRNAMVAALREFDHPEENSTTSNAGWRGLAEGLEQFESATAWISSAALKQDELLQLLAWVPLREETEMAAWVKFGEQELDAECHNEFLHTVIARWSDKDHGALARWLAKQPASDFARTAAATFAEYLAEESFETALAKLRTLPAGPLRRAAFSALAKNLPPGFAESQEIQRESGR